MRRNGRRGQIPLETPIIINLTPKQAIGVTSHDTLPAGLKWSNAGPDFVMLLNFLIRYLEFLHI